MKKGFTLAELIGVVVILGAIALIIIPIVIKSIKEGNDELYNSQIENIKLSLQLWTSEYQKPNKNESITLSLSQLKESGLVEMDIKNPVTKELLPNDMVLKIINNEGIIEYQVIDEGVNKQEYLTLPYMKLVGNALTYVELGEEYIDEGIVDKDNNKISANIDIEPLLDTDIKGVYVYKYTYQNNVIYRTVVVRDTKAPQILFDDLTINLDEYETYDFLSDIVVTDNSHEQVNVEVVKNFNYSVGTFSIKYIATDSSGNVATKYRNVTVE